MINPIQQHRAVLAHNLNNQINGNFISEYINIEKSLGNDVEVYTHESLSKFKSDLHKAFQSFEISQEELEKGLKDMSHLEKKVITNKQGHKQTVYVRHLKTGEQHQFEHNHDVTFEHKGKQLNGKIVGLKHNDKTDKFGTAIIHDSEGNKYEKSLRGIEHRQNGGDRYDNNSEKATEERKNRPIETNKSEEDGDVKDVAHGFASKYKDWNASKHGELIKKLTKDNFKKHQPVINSHQKEMNKKLSFGNEGEEDEVRASIKAKKADNSNTRTNFQETPEKAKELDAKEKSK